MIAACAGTSAPASVEDTFLDGFKSPYVGGLVGFWELEEVGNRSRFCMMDMHGSLHAVFNCACEKKTKTENNRTQARESQRRGKDDDMCSDEVDIHLGKPESGPQHFQEICPSPIRSSVAAKCGMQLAHSATCSEVRSQTH